MSGLPRVSALVTAYNSERFVGEALDSALGQDYPAERLVVVVVDDGSTDATADEIAARVARHPGRIRVVRQENAGYVAATNRAVAEGSGELFALLDSDDVWPADKLRRQVAALAERPEAGLLYGDMTVIDADGAVLDPAWLGGEQPPQGRRFTDLLRGNPATSSSIVMRAELARRLCPIPPGIAFADWYFAIRAAQESEVVYLPEPRTLYRFHGANMSLGTSGAERAGQLRKSLALQRWFLRRLRPGAASAQDLLAAWQSFEAFAAELQDLADTPFTATVAVTDDDRGEARQLSARARLALARGDVASALTTGLRAAAADPWCEQAREAVALAAAYLAG
jgi:glycosyltransferase involved in cell wall biosynthesis